MDLGFNDVIELLNVSREKLETWIKEGKIPAYRVQDQYFFSREVIDNWLVQHNLEREPFDWNTGEKENNGSLQFALFRAIHKGEVLHEVSATNKEDLIKAATKEIARKVDVEEEMLADLLIERERLMSTALGNGVAVPHTRDFLLSEHQDAVFIVFPKDPIDYASLDHKKVDVLFFLLACEDKRHLHLLSKIAHLSLVSESLDFFKSKPTKHEILKFVRNWEGQIKGAAKAASLEKTSV
ncbi:hypothetical protein AB751O23_BN_00030 [Chlamydiales bacterium SCGC AB-751-O23]|jgi:nitrogen PTS system EIIA component|nr:hypothetical protein AB751O23_BN_00030 [Chlamydiales bacterium SCGC AB-751-O23]